MSKYDLQYQPEGADFDLKGILTDSETVIWEGKPKKSAYIINKAATMFPIALIWLLFDGGFIATFFTMGADEIANQMLWFIIPFFALHLMPVWIWLGSTLTAGRHWKNTAYAVTDKRIVIKSGFVSMQYQSIYYKDIQNVNLHVGIIDKLLGVGDIYFQTNGVVTNSNGRTTNARQCFFDIENAYELYPKVQKIVMDIQTDIEYPNDLRPSTNSGYNTEYQPK